MEFQGMNLNLTHFFQFFSVIAPFLLPFVLCMISVFNQDIKGLVYLAALIFTAVVAIFLNKQFGTTLPANPICNVINFPYDSKGNNIPYFNSVAITFTFMYLLYPMIANGSYNVPIILFTLFIYIIDVYIKWFVIKCVGSAEIAFGTLIGLVCAFTWCSLFYFTDNNSVLYFNNLPDGKTEKCSTPDKQTFKCAVYKNGQLIQNL